MKFSSMSWKSVHLQATCFVFVSRIFWRLITSTSSMGVYSFHYFRWGETVLIYDYEIIAILQKVSTSKKHTNHSTCYFFPQRFPPFGSIANPPVEAPRAVWNGPGHPGDWAATKRGVAPSFPARLRSQWASTKMPFQLVEEKTKNAPIFSYHQRTTHK